MLSALIFVLTTGITPIVGARDLDSRGSKGVTHNVELDLNGWFPRVWLNLTVGQDANDRQKLSVLVDTGSGDTWFASSESTCSDLDRSHGVFKPINSALPGSFNVHFGDGTSASGKTYLETVCVEDQCAPMVVGATTSCGVNSRSGIMGRGMSNLNTADKAPTYVDMLRTQGVVYDPSTTFDFGCGNPLRPHNRIRFGEPDPSTWTGDPQKIPTSYPGSWQVKGTPYVDSKPIGNAIGWTFDTGTPLIMMPEDMLNNYFATIPGSTPPKDSKDNLGMGTIPRNSSASPLEFRFADDHGQEKKFTLPKDALVCPGKWNQKSNSWREMPVGADCRWTLYMAAVSAEAGLLGIPAWCNNIIVLNQEESSISWAEPAS